MTMAASRTRLLPDPLGTNSSAIGVARRAGVYRVIAVEPIPAGTSLMTIEGLYVDEPSRYSVQLGAHIHVEPPIGTRPGEDPERYSWRYLNHSCAPNSAVSGRQLIALRDIAPWEEIAFDYNTTELDMATPFACACGHCDGSMIRGFRHLSPEAQLRLAPRLAAHLRALLPVTSPRGVRE